MTPESRKMQSSLAGRVFEFAGFTLDLARGCLRAGDQQIAVRPKSFDVLHYLLENPGRLVPKDELVKTVWPNTFVTDDALTHCVSEVREAIGDSDRRIITTVPRRGYLFAAPVSVRATDAGSPALPVIARPSSQIHVEVPSNLTSIDAVQSLALPDKPSIAVLPFQNMSGDPDQDYFADGMVDEITTALSRFKSLFVIARNSSFAYKGKVVDIKRIGRELGVRYVLEGSVRKAGNRLRITTQLIDASTESHLWADRFDGTLEDIFDLQDQVAVGVAVAVAPQVEWAEIERAKRKPTESLDAYDYYLRGMTNFQWTREDLNKALRLLYGAIALDPDFASAHGLAAFCYVWRKANAWTTGLREKAEATRVARRAAELGRDDTVALNHAGQALAYIAGDLEGGDALIDRALALNPNLAAAWYSRGLVKSWLGESDVAIEHLAHAMRLNPLDPMMFGMQFGVGLAHLLAGRNDEASSWAQKALRAQPNFLPALRVLAASTALAGRLEAAQNAIARVRQIDPTFCISNLKDRVAVRRPNDLAKFADGLRKAGLPE
jgi:TolB-like protein/tetratricopeptide (TPR) repeat protein